MNRDERFYRKWTAIRAKGKGRFVLSRGLFHGFLLYIVWAAATWFLDKDKFDPDFFITRYYYYFLIYMIVGFIISSGAWRGQNTRYDNLTRYYEKQRKKNLP
ncbi:MULTISPECIES: hypothetical protein [Paenibacillus]|uniref:Uncharacterized protein n=1 Tax=Paenibacillus lautus TaxID=1401 RepID=A0A1R1AVT6_PAELA|nr:hypothetical protein [Paenibacillus lautus]OME89685.1 hypothetical protein BK123_25265 [Paenibacillus lautus]